MTNALIRIPIHPECTDASVRIIPLDNHWLEITCPYCGTLHADGRHRTDPIFRYGDDVTNFHCHDCSLNGNFFEEPAYKLERIEDGYAVISKVPAFEGKIEYCFYTRTVGASL